MGLAERVCAKLAETSKTCGKSGRTTWGNVFGKIIVVLARSQNLRVCLKISVYASRAQIIFF